MKKFIKFWNENKVLNYVIFHNLIAKLQKKGLKKYLSSIFLSKNVIFKTILLIIFAALIFGLGFGLRHYFLTYDPGAVVLNPGVAFSHLAHDSSSVVYFVQAIPCIIAFFIFVFVPQWWISFGFVMMFCGGLMNIIDRSMAGYLIQYGPNGMLQKISMAGKVVDYFNGGSSVFNIADVFIVTGVCFAVASLFLYAILVYLRDKKTEAQRHEEGDYDPLDEAFETDLTEADLSDNNEPNSVTPPTVQKFLAQTFLY
ncbi:signal peptidase II [Ureaplasma ceti]|uniref:Signal peptidase II n=1 Tax=Ureaplasma ceti TaxID=3119530 RepID=A0ABP9UB18_9BACT